MRFLEEVAPAFPPGQPIVTLENKLEKGLIVSFPTGILQVSSFYVRPFKGEHSETSPYLLVICRSLLRCDLVD